MYHHGQEWRQHYTPFTRAIGKSRMEIDRLPPKLAAMAEKMWLKKANIGFNPNSPLPWYQQKMYDVAGADAYIAEMARPFHDNPLPLDLHASDDDIRALAEETANRFTTRTTDQNLSWDLETQLAAAAKLGVDSERQFQRQLKHGWTDAITARLCCKRWWVRHFRREVARRLENIYRKDFNLVHKNKYLYVSDDTVNRRRQQKRRNTAIMSAVIMINELGQEFTLSELVDKSNANPAIRRAELMTRIAGFETIARDVGHCGEFITLTCSSRFHRAHHAGGIANKKYDGSTPRQASAYLNKVWGRIQSALKRAGISIYGFRVVEPHHDGTPHWHGLFFMDKAHRQTFRRIVARHGCRDSREELGLGYFETAAAARRRAREIQAAQKAAGKTVQTLAQISGSLKVEADFWQNADARIFQKVQKRVDFQAINWARGTAAGYIAKYIAKNIDGKNHWGESVGEDYESSDFASAVETAERVDAWASLHGIRQFQQIGGAPVTVWRELRREGMTQGNYHDTIVRAAVAADAGDWGKFTQIMGGVELARADRPVQLYKEDLGLSNRYGEPCGKTLRGVFDLSSGEIRISRIHEWEMTFQHGGEAAPWTGVNNSTKFKSAPKPQDFNNPTLPVNIDIQSAVNSMAAAHAARMSPERKQTLQDQLAFALRLSQRDYPHHIKDELAAEVQSIREELAEIYAAPAFDSTKYTALLQQAALSAEQERAASNQRIAYRDYMDTLDTLLPPASGKVRAKASPNLPTIRPRRFADPEYYRPDDVISALDELLADSLSVQMVDNDFDYCNDWSAI